MSGSQWWDEIASGSVQNLKGFTGVLQINGCTGYSATRIELFELDLAIDNQMQTGLTQGQM